MDQKEINFNGYPNPNGSDVMPRNVPASSDFEEDFACAVCLRLSVQPTTLTCGHTSCRACLARWYFNSKKKECPLCRQAYQGHPMINTHIRNMIAKLCPVQLAERERELEEDEDDKDVVRRYDSELSKEKRPTGNKESDLASFCAGIIIAICAFVVAYLAWYWQSSDTSLLVMKPVQTWKPRDVATWLSEMTWAQGYANMSLENNIDGNVLLSLDQNSTKLLLNITNETHERALLLAIARLGDDGLKMPMNLWEYKAIFPGRCLFLVYGLKDFPRTTFLYLYLYFHDDMFLPFVKTVTQSKDEVMDPIYLNATIDEITASEWVGFLVFAAFVPEWLVIIYTSQMFSQHSMTPYFVIATAVLYQIMEYINWILFWKNGEWRFVFPYFKQYLKQLMSAFMFMVVWPIVPNLICDMFFYGALYISPIHATKAVFHRFRELNQLQF